MLKRIAIISLAAVATLALASSLAWPHQARRVLSDIASLPQGAAALFSEHQPIIKIVDPADVQKAATEEVSRFTAFFRGTRQYVAPLVVEDIIDDTNKERIKAGLPPLKVNVLLAQSAEIKTRDMIAQQYFEHTSPQGLGVSDLGEQVGYDYIIMGENLALGDFNDAQDLVDAWMASPGHRENILNTLYQEIGVSAMRGTYQGHEVWYAVQHFGTSRSVCPSINLTNRRSIDIASGQLTQMQNELHDLKEAIESGEVAPADYQKSADRFNQLVDQYNRLLKSSQQQIALYNQEVSNFNACLKKYQASSKK